MKLYNHYETILDIPAQRTEYILGSDLLENVHTLLAPKKADSFLVLTDETVFTLFGLKFISSLKKLGKPVTTSIIKPGERQKDIIKIPKIVSPYFERGFNRQSCLISLGGGVITDLGSFIASILLRGISCINIPTTLLGQVDAAIGGKTGVDIWLPNKSMYKNMLGTIKQPNMVISDAGLLKTLLPKEIKSGLGEMFKYFVGWGKPTISQLNALKTPLGCPHDAPGVEEIAKTISLCQKIKLDSIDQDPFDSLGIREKLNLGHTVGHALEGLKDVKLSHGKAVVLGIIVVARISVLLKLLDPQIEKQIKDLTKKLGFTTAVQGVNKSDILSAMLHDKKGGTFVLIHNIGKLESRMRVKSSIIEKALEEILV